jgi:hypothetical protein
MPSRAKDHEAIDVRQQKIIVRSARNYSIKDGRCFTTRKYAKEYVREVIVYQQTKMKGNMTRNIGSNKIKMKGT